MSDAWSECLRRTRESGQIGRVIDTKAAAELVSVRQSMAAYYAMLSSPAVFVSGDDGPELEIVWPGVCP